MKLNLYAFFACLVVASLVLSSCGTGAPMNEVKSNQKRDLNPSVLPSGINYLVEGNNSFAWDMYASLRGNSGNLVFSPYSISLALAMTYAGARGATETQMQQVLHIGSDQARTHAAFNALDLALLESGKPVDKDQQPLQLRIANAVWAEQTSTFDPAFMDTLALNYGVGIQLADFVNKYDAVRLDVNDWVEDMTEDKIRDLIPQGVFNPDTRMALVNAIYFKGDWLDQFEPDATHDSPFHLLDGSQVDVPTMSADMFIPYASGDGWQMVELAYAGQTASMLVIVPDAGRFAEIETALNNERLVAMRASMQPTSMMLSIPKFKFEGSFGLADQLSAMGMPDAFDRGRADFSGMTGKRDMFVSSVIHKAFIAVDEKGTEAAAATAVILAATGAMLTPLTVNVDRPFIFVIRHASTNQVLFIGRVLDPS